MDALKWSAYVATRLTEALLIVLGLYYVFANETDSLDALGAWDLLAILYLSVGFFALRRTRVGPAPSYVLPQRRGFPGSRFNFCFSLIASLIGLSTAILTIVSKDNEDVKAVGGVAMICGWLLLHAGYARMYAGIDHDHGGLSFPDTDRPDRVDYLYFGYTLGSTFATSDVDVTTRRMRWHVMNHNILSFFYNASVIAIAVGLLKP